VSDRHRGQARRLAEVFEHQDERRGEAVQRMSAQRRVFVEPIQRAAGKSRAARLIRLKDVDPRELRQGVRACRTRRRVLSRLLEHDARAVGVTRGPVGARRGQRPGVPRAARASRRQATRLLAQLRCGVAQTAQLCT
jgi:hypothetical protein